MADLDRELARAWERFDGCDDSNRAHELYMLADLYEDAATESGNEYAVDDADTSTLLRLLADAEWVATGSLTYRHMTNTSWEPLIGSLLDRMAASSDVRERADLVEQIAARLPEGITRDLIAGMPFAPADKSLRGLVRTLRSVWRERRAA